MIELQSNQLRFAFPEVHREAKFTVEFQRTLRIPDDGRHYPLPPGLGAFPLRHVDDHAAHVPSAWLQHGGVMLPMYQAEALWLRFETQGVRDRLVEYPFAIKIATGKQCAVSGKAWLDGLQRQPQNYMVAPRQPWLDGFVVEKGLIRQFVAMPLGSGYSAEEQLTGSAEHGGLQIAVYPMKREVFERRFPVRSARASLRRRMSCDAYAAESLRACASPAMGLAAGGSMRQEVYEDPFGIDDWDLAAGSRCFVHLCNSLVWHSITGARPPHPAPTAKEYTSAGLPWFDYYDDSSAALPGAPSLAGLKSVTELSQEKQQVVLPENESVTPDNLVIYRKGLGRQQVREGAF